MYTEKEQFLDSYEKEHATTMRVLRAYPTDKLDLKPAEKCNTARGLAWIFVMERYLGMRVFNDEYRKEFKPGTPQPPPESWDELLATLEKVHKEFGDLVRSTPDAKLSETVRFFTGPKTMGEIPRIAWLWFLVSDQIHHRGQFTVYSRIAGGKVPSIYGPSADEPWT